MSCEGESARLTEILQAIQSDLKYDPNLVFLDSFERVSTRLSDIIDILTNVNKDAHNYWVVYNMVNKLVPICQKLIFAGYSDQILDFVLTLFNIVGSNPILITSKYIPFRLNIFCTVCEAFSNTVDNRDKDADSFVNTFKDELLQYKQLEEGNINGLTDTIKICTGEKTTLFNLYSSAFHTIDLISVHFSTTEDIDYEKVGSSRKSSKKRQSKPSKDVKEESAPIPVTLPQQETVQMIANSFSPGKSKGDFTSKYSQITQAWTHAECNISATLLHKLLYCFMRCGGTIETLESLQNSLPDDPVVQLAASYQKSDYAQLSEILAKLSKEEISADFVIFNQISSKIWHKFSTGSITDPLVLRGPLQVMCISPNPDPITIALMAVTLGWHYDSLGEYGEAVNITQMALEVVESFRDIFAVRKTEKIIASTRIPNKSHDQSFLMFERWLECVHIDLLTISIRSQLKQGLEIDTQKAREQYVADIEESKVKKEKTTKLYGTLSAKQKAQFDAEINSGFKPPTHAEGVEQMLLEKYKSNNPVKAILMIQMAFFRPSKAPQLLEQARQFLSENLTSLPLTSPVLYVNRTEAAFAYDGVNNMEKSVALYGKEASKNSYGLTLANTALQGTGIKQDKVEPFLVTNLKPNTLYSFAFAAYDSEDELIDTIGEPFTITTTQSLHVELIWCYIASAAFKLRDMASFDAALSLIIQQYADVLTVPDDNKFFQNINPFNRFNIRPSTFNEPAPLLRSFASTLMMAARLFASKPLHATAFHKVALEIAQVLILPDLTLQICQEMFILLQPILANAFHSRWVIHPLLFIVNALKMNKKTAQSEKHQSLLSKVSYVLDDVFVKLMQEKQLANFVMNSVIELPPNEYRTSFLLFASRYHLLESSTGDSTLPLAAADIFRSSPERSYDDLFSKFKGDPNFLPAAVFLIASAQNDGLTTQAANWSGQALEQAKNLLGVEPHDANPGKKKESRSSSKASKTAKKPVAKKGQKDAPQPTPEELAQTQLESAAAAKIQAAWNKYSTRRKSIIKFEQSNKYRAALNMLAAMSIIENEAPAISQTGSIVTERKSTKKTNRKQTKKEDEGEESPTKTNVSDQSVQIITYLKRAIVLSERIDDVATMRSSCNILKSYLSHIAPGSPSVIGGVSPLDLVTYVLTILLPFNERWAHQVLRELLLTLVANNCTNNLSLHLELAASRFVEAGTLLWTIPDELVTESLEKATAPVQRRDPAENLFFQASDILDRAERPLSFNESGNLKTVSDTAINLQHKQRLSISISLMQRMGFLLIKRGQIEQGIQKLLEALECHFRMVHVYEKVNQIISSETEDKFYQKHSWAGCISIFAIASVAAQYSDKAKAMMLSKLAAYAVSALFYGSPQHPTKALDFAGYEPVEIIPGIDIFNQIDPNQRLMEPVAPEMMTAALVSNIGSLISYEMHFEAFKPIALACHYFRFITRDRKFLARSRLAGVKVCCQFGFIKQAIEVMNDVITGFGQTKATKEYTPSTSQKRIQFNSSEAPFSQTNTDCAKTLTSSSTVNSINQTYGFTIASQYVICVSQILLAMYEANSPDGTPSGAGAAQPTTTRRSHKKSGHHSKKEASLTSTTDASQVNASNASSLPVIDVYDSTVQFAESMVRDFLGKEFRADQMMIKMELELELANIKMAQWSWESAITICQKIISEIDTIKNSQALGTTLSDSASILPCGITAAASNIIGKAAFNVHDLVTADRYGGPYTKALVYIYKADLESAAMLLAQIAVKSPVTTFYKDYVLACAQLVLLFCYQRRLVDVVSARVPSAERPKLVPQVLVKEIVQSTEKFFVEQLGFKGRRNLFLKNTHLLVRLMHLQALVEASFGSSSDAVCILGHAQEMMQNLCPFVSHGLQFLLASSLSVIQMRSFIGQNPAIIQFWNKEVNPLKTDPTLIYSEELVSTMILHLNQLFSSNPDCVVHPMSQQAALDLAVLTGLGPKDDGQRFERSVSALQFAATVRSSSRFIQSIIAGTQDVPPAKCPIPLLNDNKDCTLRGLAAAYYSHICELDYPVFDTSLLELRTLYFYRCFEEQCASFQLSKYASTSFDPGTVVGQWYLIDGRSIKLKEDKDRPNDTMSIRSKATSISRTTTTTRSSTTSAARQLGQLVKGSFLVFVGIAVETDESRKKRGETGPKFTPLLFINSASELKAVSDELAETAIEYEEGSRNEAEPVEVEKAKDDKKGKKKTPSRAGDQPAAPARKLASQQMSKAETRWTMVGHRIEALFNKSCRVVAAMSASQEKRWPAEIRVKNVDITCAKMMSRLFNQSLGISDKSTMIADWLCSNTEVTIPTNAN